MSSPGQKRGNYGHAMASFEGHSFCARCREKGKGKDMCVESPTTDCKFCLLLTPEQKAQLATPSYELKKEMPGKQNFLHLVKTVLWLIHLPWQLLVLFVTQLPFLPCLTLLLKRNLRRKNHLSQSPRKLLRNQLQIRKWRS